RAGPPAAGPAGPAGAGGAGGAGDALAGGAQGQDHPAGRVAPAASALGLGEPHGAPYPRTGALARRPWGAGALHPPLGFLAPQGRVDPAYRGTPGAGRAAARDDRPVARLAGGDRAGLACRSPPVAWGGTRAARRARGGERRQALAGSGACIRRSLRRTRYGYGRYN